MGLGWVRTASDKVHEGLRDESSIEQLRSRNAVLRRELDELRAENDTLRSDSALLKTMLSSRAWRATQPLRSAVRFTRGGFQAARSLALRMLKRSLPAAVQQRLRDVINPNASSANE